MRADDVDAGGAERVGAADRGADIEIVGPVFDGDFIRVSAAGVKISFDCRHGPVSVTVEHVAAVTVVKELGVIPGVEGRRAGDVRPRLTRVLFIPRTDTDFAEYRLA